MTAVVSRATQDSPLDRFATCRCCGLVAQPVGAEYPIDDGGRPVLDRGDAQHVVWFTCPVCCQTFDARTRLVPSADDAVCSGCGTASPAADGAVLVSCHGCGRRFVPVGVDDLDRQLVLAVRRAAELAIAAARQAARGGAW